MTGREQERRLNRREADVSESRKDKPIISGKSYITVSQPWLEHDHNFCQANCPLRLIQKREKKSSFFQSVRLEERFSIPTFFLSWLDWKNWWFALKDQVWLWYCFIIFSTQTTHYSLFFLPLTTITLSWSVFNSLPLWYVVSSTAPFLVTDEKMEIN